MDLTPKQKELLLEGLKVVRRSERQKKEIAGRTNEVLAVQVIKCKGFTNLIFDAYGPTEQVYTIDDASFAIFIDRLAIIKEQEMGHDMFTFTRYDDRCPEMETEQLEEEQLP